ncbi:MAG: hypothetical protein ACI91Z_001886 [Yoonia sp.]|jgi:hypothetical protein
MRGLLRIITSRGQKIAQNWGGQFGRFGERLIVCNTDDAAVGKNSQQSAICLYSYPSPDRCGPFWFVPVTPFLRAVECCFAKTCCVALTVKSINLTHSNQTYGGIFSCLKHLTFSRQPRSLALRLVSITMQSARLLGLALAALQAKLSVTTTVLKARLRAAFSAHLSTTSKVTRLIYSMKINETAAAGHPCARRFCF